MDEKTIIDTASGAADGQNKCPKCGATDISLNTASGKLRCNFCRFEFEPQALETMKTGVGDLAGEQIGSGAADIDAAAETTVTLKCTSCGAEVVIDLNEASQARCHWCRNMLSINSKVPNGIVPDAVLPFKMKKEEAEQRISDYVGSRRFFANKVFQREFTTDNIMGVYFPYMLVDMKGHAVFDGEGEIETGSYERGSDKDKETIFKVDRYRVHRECDVVIDDLAVESSARRAGKTKGETNNIINAILPFDTENCVKYDANYLKGFTSEKRDVNKGDLQGIVDSQEKEAIKFSLNNSVSKYDRGVHWNVMDVQKEGERWISAYLPVWLYSYVENPGKNNQLTHYVAVNARTAETIGSVPINKARMSMAAVLIGLAAMILMGFIVGWYATDNYVINAVTGLIVGVISFMVLRGRYRNTGARHHFEHETKIKLKQIASDDALIKSYETKRSDMADANNHTVNIEKLKV